MLLKFSTTLLTGEAAWKAVPTFTKIHGHPPRGDHNTLRDEMLQALGVVNMPDLDHGLVGGLTKPAEFQWVTGEEENYDIPDTKPLPYEDSIDHDIMSPDKIKIEEAEHIQQLTSWHVRKGTLLRVVDQIRKVLDKKIYKRLKKKVTGYKNITVCQ